MTPQETHPDLPVSDQESPVEARLAVACCRAGGTECSGAGMGPAEGGHHYLHYLHCSLSSGQINGREHSPAHQQKIGLKITEHGPAYQNKTQFPPQSISPIRKFP